MKNQGPYNITGLILAAGESRRMGFPKALLDYRGATFIETIAACFATRCASIIAVLGAHSDRILAADWRRPASLRIVYNPDYLTGQTSSLQAGLRAVPTESDGVLFTLVDHPAVAPETLDSLLAPPLPLIRIPRYHGERGHPTFFRNDLIPEFAALPIESAANHVTRAHRAQTEFIDLDDPGVLFDIDDPSAYQQLIARHTGSPQ